MTHRVVHKGEESAAVRFVTPANGWTRRAGRRFFAFAQNDSGVGARDESSPVVSARYVSPLIYAAPIIAIIVGVAAEFADFRALRYPILALMLAAVAATRYAREATARRRGVEIATLSSMLRAVALGVLTWGAAQTVYVILHVMQGERFDAPRFGPQPLQALGLIAAHALFLGAPTGLAAGVILRVHDWLRRRHTG